jgi:nitroreductase
MAAGCADVPPRLVADLVAAATLAPSMHNNQPWRFRYEPASQTIELAVLCTPSGSRSDWLRAGQALQRALLTATLRGIAVGPLTQPLETAEAWLVRDPQPGFEYPQMILRVGYGLPVPRTPRRPVSELLDTGPDQRND